jgi:hypothetical protein
LPITERRWVRHVDIEEATGSAQRGRGGDHRVGVVDVLEHGDEEDDVEMAWALPGQLVDALLLNFEAVAAPGLVDHGAGELEAQTTTFLGLPSPQQLSPSRADVHEIEAGPAQASRRLAEELPAVRELLVLVMRREVLVGIPVEPLGLDGKGEGIGKDQAAEATLHDPSLDPQAVALVLPAAVSEHHDGGSPTGRTRHRPHLERVALGVGSHRRGLDGDHAAGRRAMTRHPSPGRTAST